jgi:ABC-type branched-subunit amino acid transport system ATPase component
VQRAFDEPSLGLAPLAVRQVFDRLAALRDTSVVIVEQDTRAALSVGGARVRTAAGSSGGGRAELSGALKSAYLSHHVSAFGADRGGAISRTTGTT